MADIKLALQEITLAKALKVKNRLAVPLAKVQSDIQAYNSVLEGQADQVNVSVLAKNREELVEGLVAIKTAINEANRDIQRAIYDLTEKKASVQFLNGIWRPACGIPECRVQVRWRKSGPLFVRDQQHRQLSSLGAGRRTA